MSAGVEIQNERAASSTLRCVNIATAASSSLRFCFVPYPLTCSHGRSGRRRLAYHFRITSRIALLAFPTRAINVIVTVSRAEGTYMKTSRSMPTTTSACSRARRKLPQLPRPRSIHSLAGANWRNWQPIGRWPGRDLEQHPWCHRRNQVHQPKERACGPTSSVETSRKSNSLGVGLQQGRSWQCYALLQPSASVLSGFWKAALMNAPANLVTSLAALATCA